MRLISQSELLRATRLELHAMLRRIAADLPSLPEGSHELRIAHYNLHNIRVALARPDWAALISRQAARCTSAPRRFRRSCLGRLGGGCEERDTARGQPGFPGSEANALLANALERRRPLTVSMRAGEGEVIGCRLVVARPRAQGLTLRL
jgi:hypothetical protein